MLGLGFDDLIRDILRRPTTQLQW